MVGFRIFSWLLIAYQTLVQHCLQIGLLGRMAVTGILLSYLIPQFRIQINRTAHTIILVAFAGTFGLEGLTILPTQGVYGLFKLLSEYLLLVQALELIYTPRPTTTNYLPGLSVLTFAMLLMSAEADISLQSLNYLCIGFVILLAFAMRPDLLSLLGNSRERGKRGQVLAMILCAALVSGWLFERELNRNLPPLRQFLVGMNLGGDNGGNVVREQQKARLVEQAGLGSLNQLQQESPGGLAFIVRAEEAPGYLRTVAFTRFDGVQWQNPWEEGQITRSMGFHRVTASNTIPDQLEVEDQLEFGMSLFELNRAVGGVKFRKCIVEVPIGRGKLLPVPFDATYILGKPTGRFREILIDPHGAVFRGSLANQSFVFVHGPGIETDPSDEYLESLLEVPANDVDFLGRLAEQVCRSSNTPEEKVVAIQDFFQRNFSYSLASQPDKNLSGRSPLQAFLSERREAHCEYFATATALLLRTQGIPCRLAVGYLVYEKSEETGDYVALNKHAHAWVEAFNYKTKSWSIVESTPTIPDYIRNLVAEVSTSQESNTNVVAGLLDNRFSLYSVFNRISSSFYAIWLAILSNRFAWLLPGAFVAVYFIFRYGLNVSTKSTRPLHTTSAILKADRLARKLGLQRGATETCLQFANRMQELRPDLIELATWYRNFSHTRYRSGAFVLPHLPKIKKLPKRKAGDESAIGCP